MASISGKNQINWEEVASHLAPIEVIHNPALVKKKTRDFIWFSPILNDELKGSFGDLVVIPKSIRELKLCLHVAYQINSPVVIRGGGTGNYGQAVPVDGGLIIETTSINQILEIGNGYVRVQAGALIADINAAFKPSGQEMARFPATQKIATVGGFVAGGSSGIGSLATGALREPGNLIEIKVLSLSNEPREHVFTSDDVLNIHHAWGINGVITEITLRCVKTHNWLACLATFDSYEAAYRAGLAVSRGSKINPKLVSIVDARIVEYFRRLCGHVRSKHDLLVSYIRPQDLMIFNALIKESGGHLDLALSDQDREAAKIPHVFEFSYNHTTLQVLKGDRRATYQQVGVDNVDNFDAITRLRADLGDEVWTHHEFIRFGGKVSAIDLPIIWFSSPERLQKINEIFTKHGFTVYDAHINQIEAGGLHNTNFKHLAWKKRLDPKGLLNSAKSAAWNSVKELSPEEIEAKEIG